MEIQPSDVLRSPSAAPGTRLLVALQGGGARPPLFCLHGRTGDVAEYFPMAQHLGPDQPVHGLQARGVDGRSAPHATLEAMAADYVEEITRVSPGGPYLLCGFSLGGLVAWEVGQQLLRRGHDVALLALLDTDMHMNPALPREPDRPWSWWRRRMAYHADQFKRRPLKGRFAYVSRQMTNRLHRSKRGPAGPQPADGPDAGERAATPPREPWMLPSDEPDTWSPLLRTLVRTITEAVRHYNPRPYPGPVTLFLASEVELDRRDRRLPGRLAAGGLQVHRVSGSHLNLLLEPHVRVLAKSLRRRIDQAEDDARLTRLITGRDRSRPAAAGPRRAASA